MLVVKRRGFTCSALCGLATFYILRNFSSIVESLNKYDLGSSSPPANISIESDIFDIFAVHASEVLLSKLANALFIESYVIGRSNGIRIFLLFGFSKGASTNEEFSLSKLIFHVYMVYRKIDERIC